MKGSVLTAIERGCVDDYLRLEPQYRKYEALLWAAALGGLRAAALEYGTAFENPEFIALDERLTGEAYALKMARHVSSDEARERWCPTAAEQGSRTAMEALAGPRPLRLCTDPPCPWPSRRPPAAPKALHAWFSCPSLWGSGRAPAGPGPGPGGTALAPRAPMPHLPSLPSWAAGPA